MRVFAMWVKPEGDMTSQAIEKKMVFLSWGVFGLEKLEDKQDFVAHFKNASSHWPKKNRRNQVVGRVTAQLYRFLQEMNVKDWIVVPHHQAKMLWLATIAGPPRRQRIGRYTYYVRPVKWRGAIPFHAIPKALSRQVRPHQTCVEITPLLGRIEKLFQIGHSPNHKNKQTSESEAFAERTRQSSIMDELRKDYSQTVKEGKRLVNPRHQHYQVQLKKFLKRKGIAATFERDNVDVQFLLGRTRYIGEIKVTSGHLRLADAFRVAVGQLLDYAHLRFPHPPQMVMFLDKAVHAQRVNLASKLSISVVTEIGRTYRLLNASTAPALGRLFQLKA